MKKFLFVALGVIFALAMYAAQPSDVGKVPQSTPAVLTQAEAQPMVVDFMYADFSVNVIATATETSYVLYQAMPAEVSELKFKLEMPVFRLCRWNRALVNSQITTQELARSNLPPNRRIFARKNADNQYRVG